MATGFETYLTRMIGEYLVSSKLGRLGLVATPCVGNVPTFDLLVADQGGNARTVQVKTIRGGSWQLRADQFLNIELGGGKQVVRGRLSLPDPDLLYVFVLLKDDERDYFYICNVGDIQTYLESEYKALLERQGGVRPKNPESTHFAIRPEELKQYRDNWKLIKSCFPAAAA